MAAFLQLSIESAIFTTKGRYFMTVNLSHPDALDPINNNPKIFKTSLSSGNSESAIFNIHSFSIGDVSATSPDTLLDLKAYKVIKKQASGGFGQELIGSYQLAIA